MNDHSPIRGVSRLMWATLVLSWLLSGSALPTSAAEGPVVRAVMFYSPSCPHCHQVITEVLPPLLELHGGQFEIIGVNTAETGGQTLYQAAIAAFSIPQERRGVPTLVIGDVVLVGSLEIPEQLPGLIEEGLAQGGKDWPAIPGLAEALAASESEPDPTGSPVETPEPTAATEATPVATTAPAPFIGGGMENALEDTTWRDRFARDPLGNGISVLVLLGMLVSVVYQGWSLTRAPVATPGRRQGAIPLLVALGLGVAGYLAYVETPRWQPYAGRWATATRCSRANTPCCSGSSRWRAGRGGLCRRP